MRIFVTVFIFTFFLFAIQCNNKSTLINYSESGNKFVEDSITDKKQKLINKFEKRRLKNEKKYDSLKIKGDSTKNKSSLSGFNGSTPRYNETN